MAGSGLAIHQGLSGYGLDFGPQLGAGSCGVVYRARERPHGRDVAVKLIHADRADEPVTRRRFERDRMLPSLVRHGNVLPVYRSGETGGRDCFVMPLARYGSLADLLERVPLPIEATAWVIARAAEGTAALHAAAILHRDIKPGNLLLDGGPDGVVEHLWLTGLGLGCPFESAADDLDLGLGTARYIAPERRAGAVPGPPADVYALGMVLQELLTGGPRPPQGKLANRLWRICHRATAHDPSDRHRDARELTADLALLRGTPPTVWRRVTLQHRRS